MQKKQYEYRSECALFRFGKIKAQFRYPVGEPFGNFYEELAEKCKIWAEREYSDYRGKGIRYRFSAKIEEQGDIVPVILSVRLYEKGIGKTAEMNFAHNWLANGRMLPVFEAIDKKTRKKHNLNDAEYCIEREEIFILSKKGEKISTGVKIGNFSQEFSPYNLKNLS